eukprot:TRINITY_DN36283_c0_g1_i1.p1 TRINITY_DN36283_c0_g1~~TRINITY_DN36283_c0_g1_i1.p1  ORF type:complete len:136 (+),score=51.08 TRINITY_DN36283_c0_g1_i1:60-467(+)
MGDIVSIPVYVSRVAHTVGGALLLAVVAAPYMFQGPQITFNHKFLIAGTVGLLFSGLFNAMKLNPKKMGDKAGGWRHTVYGGKLTALVCMTPLVDKVVGAEAAIPIKFGAAVSAFAMGAFARFYREKHADPNWKQ